MVTMKDVARAAGVSVATVSYAFSKSSKVSATQRERIYSVAAGLGYAGPNIAGSSLRSGRIGAVGVIVPDSPVQALEDPSVTLLMKGIAEIGNSADIALTLFPASRGGSPDSPPNSLVLRGLVDGVVIHNVPDGHPLVEAIIARGIPAVVVDSPRSAGLPFVAIDDRHGAYLQMDHILSLGHRRIGIIVDKLGQDSDCRMVTADDVDAATERNARERLAGYFAAARDHHLPVEELSIVVAGNIDRAAGAEATRILLDAAQPTALVATSDVHAVAAWQVLRERGLAVPDDMSVIGFDDAPVAELLGLSTIHQPIVEKGRAAATILLDRLGGGTRTRSLMKTSLVVRASTAPPRESSTAPPRE
ncbi:LacI family DNA-binding transcriptional regulator [Rhodococcus opacus]|uniref:LacI family DNA-binding transcriptional regulator n=1 Tax=Rhodococcus TaxID=1827 RepID=UPI001B3008AC|nr:LacI family DNA-binding transcriptional regulator [Rhodococcus opacus]